MPRETAASAAISLLLSHAWRLAFGVKRLLKKKKKWKGSENHVKTTLSIVKNNEKCFVSLSLDRPLFHALFLYLSRQTPFIQKLYWKKNTKLALLLFFSDNFCSSDGFFGNFRWYFLTFFHAINQYNFNELALIVCYFGI